MSKLRQRPQISFCGAAFCRALTQGPKCASECSLRIFNVASGLMLATF